MKSYLIPISLSILFFPIYNTGQEEHISSERKRSHEKYYFREKSNASVLYNELDLSALGLSQIAFETAYKGYKKLVEKGKLLNDSILTISDLSQSSVKKRLYVLDLINNKVLMNTWVAHGRGSGGEYASRFSNRSNSHQSSLGFYITGSIYHGQQGLSLRLKGIETGINHLADQRNIVIHGASYVGEQQLRKSNCMGRSYGCPAVPRTECAKIIELISGGSCLFIYHPSRNYFQQSKIFND